MQTQWIFIKFFSSNLKSSIVSLVFNLKTMLFHKRLPLNAAEFVPKKTMPHKLWVKAHNAFTNL